MDGIKELLALNDQKMAALHDARLKLLQSGVDLIDLSMLNPDMAPDRHLSDALVQAVLKPHNHRYAVSRGVRKLRSAFAQKYQSSFGVVIEPQTQCVVTMGSKEATNLSLMALALPHAGADRKKVLVGSPVYPAFRSAAAMSGFELETFQISESEEQMLAEIRAKLALGGIRVCLFNFPSNPTSVTVTSRFWKSMIALAEEFDLFLLNDFTYGEMCYDSASTSILALESSNPRVAESYSLSKAYSIPGWRVGALLGSSELVNKISQVKSYLDYGNFLPIQHAATVALTAGSSPSSIVTLRYQRRARLLVDGLKANQWVVKMPSAGAAVWARLPSTLQPELEGREGRSYSAVEDLLHRYGIFALPGEVFGPYPDFVRFALVVPEERIRQMISRFEHCEVIGERLESRASV